VNQYDNGYAAGMTAARELIQDELLRCQSLSRIAEPDSRLHDLIEGLETAAFILTPEGNDHA
jgi:hypothetical protein